MKIRAYEHELKIHPIRERNKSPLEVLAILDKKLRKATAGRDFSACAIPYNHSLSCMDKGFEAYRDGALLLLRYSAGKEATIPQVYADIRSLSPNKLLKQNGFRAYEEWAGKRKCVFGPIDETLFWVPFDIHFSEGNGDEEVQKNTLTVSGLGNPGVTFDRAVERIAKKRDASVEIRKSKGNKERGFVLSHGRGSITCGMAAPEVEIEINWKGTDFDKKAIDLFGEVRKALFSNHMKTVREFGATLVERAYRGSGKESAVSLNQEPLNKGINMGDIVASFEAEIPFRHGDTPVRCHLSHYRFRGR